MIQILLLLPLLLFVPYLGSYFYFPGSEYSDLAISHYPNAVFLSRALQTWGHVPLWSPTILSGYPFAANPLSGLWYPPGWLAFLIPSPVGFNVVFLLHLVWGGLGMYRLLKSSHLSPAASILGALLFEVMPKTIGHYAAGHITLVYAVSWTPWLIYLERLHHFQFGRKRFTWLPGVILGIIALADVRWVLFAGLLWLGYKVALAWEGTAGFNKEKAVQRGQAHLSSMLLNWGAIGGYVFSQIIIAGLIAAPIIVPLLEYTQLSTRIDMTPADVFTLSLPLVKLISLLFPDSGGTPEWIIYPTNVALGLGLFATFAGRIRSRCKFWIGAALVSLIFSLGSNLPLLSAIGHLPGFSLVRVPSRALFIFGFSLAVLSAYAVDGLSAEFVDRRFSSRISPEMPVLFAALLSISLTIGLMAMGASMTPGMPIGAVGMAVVAAWIILRQRKRIPPGIWERGVLVICLINLGIVNRLIIDPRTEMTSSREEKAAAKYIDTQPGAYRIYSPSYSLPQQLAADNGLQLADGVDPLQLKSYRDFMVGATGIPSSGYSVTLPPFINGDPETDTQAFSPDLKKLGLLNVRYIVSAFEMQTPGLSMIFQSGETRVYENPEVYPRAWIQSDINPPQREDIRPVSLNSWEPNKIVVNADGPGLLVLSEIAYPGWQMRVDGIPAQAVQVDGLLRGVWIGPGQHQVINQFKPLSVSQGMLLGGVGWILALILSYLMSRKHL